MTQKGLHHQNYLQFHYLPYLQVGEELKLGKYIVWSFDKKAICDKTIASAISKRLSIYKNYYGSKISPPTIVSYRDKNNFAPFSKKQIADLEFIKLLLCFLGMEKSNRRLFYADKNNKYYHGYCTSDSWTLYTQNFQPDKDGFAISSGAIHTSTDMCCEIDKITITAPEFINLHYKFEYDKDLFKVARKILALRNDPLIKRVRVSLDWLYNAYHNASNLSYESRLMMMGIAFEALFDIQSRNNKKEPFAIELEKLSKVKGDRKVNFIKHGDNPAAGCVCGSKKKMWAYRFYEIRNAIAHGNIPSKGIPLFYSMNHFFIAELFLIHCIKQVLSLHPKIRYKNYDEIYCRSKPPFILSDSHWRKITEEVMEKYKDKF